MYLNQFTGPEDICTPFWHPEPDHHPSNDKGYFNPIPEWYFCINSGRKQTGVVTRQVYRDLRNRRKFYEPMPAWLVKARIPGRIWNSYFKFAVERNPWDKIISRMYHWNKVNKTGRTVTVDQFLDWLTSELKDPWNSPAPYNYPRYNDPARNTLMVDHVCRYENLHQELKGVFSHLGIPFEDTLKIKAKSQYREDRRPYSEVLTNEQIGRIGELFRKEIAFMQYLPEPAITSPVS